MKGGAYPPYLNKSPDILSAKSRKPSTMQSTSYTFTDLAQMVCKVQRKPYIVGKFSINHLFLLTFTLLIELILRKHFCIYNDKGF